MTDATVGPRPDVTDMLAVHGVFRDSLGVAPGLVAGAARSGDAERVALIANYYENILSFLESHHDTEEQLVFPLLRGRCDGREALLARLAADHEEAMVLLNSAESSLAAWPSDDALAPDAVAASLEALRAQLTPHLDLEEREVLPLCAENLSLEEWGALPGHGMAHFDGDKIWLVLGMLRERMTEEQRTAMLAHMPPPALDMWTGFGEQAFKDYSAEVHAPVESTA